MIINAHNDDIPLNFICRTFKVEKSTVVRILHNVSFHHSVNVIEMLELPPYSPYFMAIECMFAEWKTYVKRGLANTRALTHNTGRFRK